MADNADLILVSGNEAIALGSIDAGASVGTGYPGTPSSETLEYFAKDTDANVEWCANEKVALEVGVGASAGGARALVTMKHVGVNVAADPLFTAAYTGVGGGLVILAADDPGMYSSQNEQDSHYYGLAAHIPVMDPADSQEAYDFTRAAYELSERFDVPVMMRSSVRISHTRTLVERSQATAYEQKPYEKDPSKWVMMPLYAKERRKLQLKRIDDLVEWADNCEFNQLFEKPGTDIGNACVICAGAAYQHVAEALPNTSILKLGVTYPLPAQKIRNAAERFDAIYVVEEGSTFLEDSVRALGVEVKDAPYGIQRYGELTPQLVRAAFLGPDSELTSASMDIASDSIPPRPPALCAGCPHRTVFKELSRQKAIVTGDIGCYTLGALPPLSCMDTCIDMGASVSMVRGMELALEGEDHRPVVGIIGDSTFGHSGVTSLMTLAYNNSAGTVVILDNRTTAMTGRQGNPFNGENLQNRGNKEIDIEKVVEALGVEDLKVVDPYDVAELRSAIKEATSATDRLSVIICKHPCVLLERNYEKPYFVAGCKGCGVCLSLGCPAIGKERDTGLAYIDADACIGCGQCQQYCRFNAIVR